MSPSLHTAQTEQHKREGKSPEQTKTSFLQEFWDHNEVGEKCEGSKVWFWLVGEGCYDGPVRCLDDGVMIV